MRRIDLLSTCRISIALSNAVPEIIAVADYKTIGNDEDGVAVVIEKTVVSSNSSWEVKQSLPRHISKR